MFTGIVQGTGVVAGAQHHAGGIRLCLTDFPLSLPKTGDSICVSGACLTVASIENNKLYFDVIAETLAKTTLGGLKPGSCVNLEPSLRVGDRLDGHFVQGHVDGTAIVDRVIESSEQHVVWLRPQGHLLPYIVPKGSVAVDGVSMTVADVCNKSFSIALIPTTIQRTTLGSLRTGDRVNMETDILVRTIVHTLRRIFPDDQAINQAAITALRGDAFSGLLETACTNSIEGAR